MRSIKKSITGKTPSQILDILTVYKEVVSMPKESFSLFIQNLDKKQEYNFVIKCFGNTVLIGNIEPEQKDK